MEILIYFRKNKQIYRGSDHIKMLTATPFKESFVFNLRELIPSC